MARTRDPVRPVVRLATRLNRRTRLTMWAIAFACMLLVASLTLVDGLSSGVDTVASRFQTKPYVYIRGSDLLSSSIDPLGLDNLTGSFSALRVYAGSLAVNGLDRFVVVAALEDHSRGNVSVPFPSGPSDSVALDAGLVREIVADSAQPVPSTVDLTLFGGSHPGLPVAPPPTGVPSLLPDDWAWVRPDLLFALDPEQGGPVQAVITDTPLDAAAVAALGLSSWTTVGAVAFAQGSVAEARAALDVLAAFIAGSIGLIVYAALGLEVRQREDEMRTLRSLGASPIAVAAIVEGQALFLSLLGAALGSALGIVAAHAVVSFAPLLGAPSLITLPTPIAAAGLASGVAVAAALLGAVPPSRRAALLARPHREAIPS